VKKVLILYGWHGSDAPHWQEWLARELSVRDCIVAFPQLSEKMTPQKAVWIREAKAAIDALRPDIVVCHSLGNILWFHLCNQGLANVAQKLLLVAPPRDLSDYEDIRSFFPVTPPVNLHAKEALLVTSADDPYMNPEEAAELARKLHVPHTVLENAGHINASSGFGPWPWVLEWVLHDTETPEN